MDASHPTAWHRGEPHGRAGRRTATVAAPADPSHTTPLTAASAVGGEDTCTPARRPRAELLAEIHALRSIIAALPVIEQAKGTIMLSHGLTAAAAFDLLHRYSDRHHCGIRDLAAGLSEAIADHPAGPEARGSIDQLLTDLADRQAGRCGEDDDSCSTVDTDPPP
jgi:hypothetical protein